jgi:hypothetical protein
MHYNATLCKEALGKKITGMSCEAYVFLFVRWVSSLPDGVQDFEFIHNFLAIRQSA